MADLNWGGIAQYAETENPNNPITINDFPLASPTPSTTTTSGSGTSPGNATPFSNGESETPPPKIINAGLDLKSKLLRPALTSHFQCWFNPPNVDEIRKYYLDGGETISFLCSEATLPGSSLMTNEINDDHTGITERHAYRRLYDDRVDFTFYVDHGRSDGNYNLILLFESWIRYCVNETSIAPDKNYTYRVRFPDEYQSPAIYLNKFERDFAGSYLQYSFLQAYPISVNSMPVSYESSQLLKCTVSFTFTRYLVKRYENKITKREFESAIDAGIAAAYGTAAGHLLAQDFLNTNKASGGSVEVKTSPQSLSLQQKIRLNRLGVGVNPGQINAGSGLRIPGPAE